MKKLIITIISFSLLLTFAGCKKVDNNDEYKNVEKPIVTMEFEKFGTVEIELNPTVAPNTVKNFIFLIESGFYDGLTIHRVSPDFVIQGGDPEGNGRGGPGYSIKGEFSTNGYRKNNLKHTQGVISMARAQPNDSAGSQFFIMLAENDYLDGKYAAFGKVTKGLDVVLEIGSVDIDSKERPLEQIVIKKVTVDTKGVTYGEPDKVK